MKKSSGERPANIVQPTEIGEQIPTIDTDKSLAALREYLFQTGEPDHRLNPKWLACKLGIDEKILLDALAYAVRDGLLELHW